VVISELHPREKTKVVRRASDTLRGLWGYDPNGNYVAGVRDFPSAYHYLAFGICQQTLKDLTDYRLRISARYAILNYKLWWIVDFGIEQDYLIKKLKEWEFV